MKFGQTLRRIRKRQHIGTDLLSEKSGVSNAQISRIERNVVVPKISTLRKLARGLGISQGKIFQIAGIEPEHANNSSPDEIDLDDAFAHHKEFTYHNKKVSPETIKYIKRMLGGGN